MEATVNSYPKFVEELTADERVIFPHCANNMLRHIDQHIDNNADHKLATRLLTFRWFLNKNIQLMDN